MLVYFCVPKRNVMGLRALSDEPKVKMFTLIRRRRLVMNLIY